MLLPYGHAIWAKSKRAGEEGVGWGGGGGGAMCTLGTCLVFNKKDVFCLLFFQPKY